MSNEKKKVNRVKCTANISGLMDNFYKDMFDDNKGPLCWCVGACPYEMFSAANVRRFQTENHAARISTRQEQAMFIEVAEAEGLSENVCSYAKINIGFALMMARGEEDKIPERYRLPKPDMLFALNTCPTMIQWCDMLSDIFKVPKFVVDAAYIYDENNWDRDVEYVKSQLYDFVRFLEKNTGRPFDWARLNEIVMLMKQIAVEWRAARELYKNLPTPASFLDALIAMGPKNTVRDEASLAFYKDFHNEVAQRAKDGIGVLEQEKYRIMWRGNFPWHKLGTLSRMLAKYDAVIISGVYGLGTYGDHAIDNILPDGFDVSDPLRTIAAEHCCRSYTRRFDWKMEHEFRRYIDEFSIDAIIIHSPRTCRPWALTTYDMAREVEEKYKLPVLVLEVDHTDPNYFHDAQVETRIKALLETIKK